jgi:hypothetical protein
MNNLKHVINFKHDNSTRLQSMNTKSFFFIYVESENTKPLLNTLAVLLKWSRK